MATSVVDTGNYSTLYRPYINHCVRNVIPFLIESQVFQPEAVSFLKRRWPTILMHDNGRSHETRISQQCLNPVPGKPWFLRVCSRSLLKTLWEKKKLLVTSNFFFSHNVFYPFRELSAIFIKLKIVVCKLFQFGRV